MKGGNPFRTAVTLWGQTRQISSTRYLALADSGEVLVLHPCAVVLVHVVVALALPGGEVDERSRSCRAPKTISTDAPMGITQFRQHCRRRTDIPSPTLQYHHRRANIITICRRHYHDSSINSVSLPLSTAAINGWGCREYFRRMARLL